MMRTRQLSVLRALIGSGAPGLLIVLLACAPGDPVEKPGSDEPGDPGRGVQSAGKTVFFRGRDGSSEGEFLYALSEDVPVRVRVLDAAGDPVPGAMVRIVDPLDPPPPGEPIEDGITGRSYHLGMTDARGRLEATVRIPVERFEVDVIVNRPGMRGPYSFEELRAVWAEFAPSARLRRSRSFLRNVTVRLEQEL